MKTAVSVILASVLAACANHSPVVEVPTESIGRYFFAYSVSNGKAVRLIQVFDDGVQTFLQFNELSNISPGIRAADGTSLRFERNGAYVVVPGVHARLTVVVEDASAEIQNQRDPRPVRSLPAASQPRRAGEASANDQAESAAADLVRLRGELAALRAELDVEKRRAALVSRGRFVVQFANNSATFEIDASKMTELVELARDVKGVTIAGYTDATTASPGASRLALRRALAVRSLLLSKGMDPSNVRIRYFGAGHFVADNSTPEGKAANRRVEIEASRRGAS